MDHDKDEDDGNKPDEPEINDRKDEFEIQEKTTEKSSKMDIRTNASTDDLLSLESGVQSPEQNQTPLNANQENDTTVQTSQPVIPMTTPSARRKSAFPSDSLRLDLDETTWSEPQAPSRPATKERLRQNLQAKAAKVTAVVQRGRTPEFRFRVILIMLFASIISLVTFTWYMYNKQLHIKKFGDNIHFQDLERTLKLLRKDELSSLLKVSLGKEIPSNLKPLNCDVLYQDKKNKNDIPNVCAEWKYRARLTILYTHPDNFSCYNVKWESLSKETKLKDCVELHTAYWYGMGELSQNAWPLNGISIPSKPFVTGDVFKNEFGGILEGYWLSSDGVAITVNPDVPLYVSLNDNNSEELCLEAKASGFPYRMLPDTRLMLDYLMCTGPDMKSLHEFMMQKHNKLPSNFTSKEFLEDIVWTSTYLQPKLDQESIQSHANHIKESGFLTLGFFLIDSRWQEEEGDFDFRRDLFNSTEGMMNILHNKGFRVLLTIQPYASLASKQFRNATDGNYFLLDTDLDVPLLTHWNKKIYAIIDATNANSKTWLLSTIEQLQSKYLVDGFFIDGGQSMFLPRSYNFAESLINPDKSISHLVNIVAEKSQFIGLNAGFMSQHAPAFIRLAHKTPTWDNKTGLQSIIPGVLTLGLLGYPLINPGSVGGDLIHALNVTKPDKELYIRWLQLTAFMPVIQVSVPPTEYDLDVIKMAKNLFILRKSIIFPVMKKAIDDYVISGAPIIRPLWWLAPTDSNAQKVGDQFAVGDTIIVAPILEEGKRSRDIYLPPGMWRDEILGQTRRGRKWIHNYSVLLDKIAYFTKI